MKPVHGHFPPVPRRTSPPDGSGGPQVPGADRAFRSGNYLSVVDPAVECAKHTNTSVFTHTAAQFVLVWKQTTDVLRGQRHVWYDFMAPVHKVLVRIFNVIAAIIRIATIN